MQREEGNPPSVAGKIQAWFRICQKKILIFKNIGAVKAVTYYYFFCNKRATTKPYTTHIQEIAGKNSKKAKSYVYDIIYREVCVCVSDCVRESENMLIEKGKKIVFQMG